MKILIAGGREEAGALIGLLLKEKHKIVAVNGEWDWCEHLASVYDRITVICGKPYEEEVLKDAGIQDCDVVVSLCGRDADNLTVCQMARELFAVKKTVCTVKNPKNVEVFQILGVDQVINTAHTLADCIGS